MTREFPIRLTPGLTIELDDPVDRKGIDMMAVAIRRRSGEQRIDHGLLIEILRTGYLSDGHDLGRMAKPTIRKKLRRLRSIGFNNPPARFYDVLSQ